MPRARVRARGTLREDERHDDHRRGDGGREDPVDQERQPVVEHCDCLPPRSATRNLAGRRSARGAVKSAQRCAETAVTKSRRSTGCGDRRATATIGSWRPSSARTMLRLADRDGGREDQGAAWPRSRRARPACCASRSRAAAARASSTRSASTAAPRRATRARVHGVTVVVDPFSAPYLRGAEIDYLDGDPGAGFKINNPNVVASCGCGHSFQVGRGRGARGTPAAVAAPAARTDSRQRASVVALATEGADSLVIVSVARSPSRSVCWSGRRACRAHVSQIGVAGSATSCRWMGDVRGDFVTHKQLGSGSGRMPAFGYIVLIGG